MNEREESTLIESARGGNLDAFNQLVLAYQDLVYHQTYSIMGSREAAEDLAQEAFIRAYRNLNSFRDGSFRAWVLRIATNAAYDELRRLKRQLTQPLQDVNEDGEEMDLLEALVDPGLNVEQRVEQSELMAAIQRGLEKLPAEYRAVVELVDVQGFDYVEAAQALGIPMGTLKSRLARARQRLQGSLRPYMAAEALPARTKAPACAVLLTALC